MTSNVYADAPADVIARNHITLQATSLSNPTGNKLIDMLKEQFLITPAKSITDNTGMKNLLSLYIRAIYI